MGEIEILFFILLPLAEDQKTRSALMLIEGLFLLLASIQAQIVWKEYAEMKQQQ